LARDPAIGSEDANANANAAALLTEVEALRHRLASLEARLLGSAPAEPRRRSSTKMTVCLVMGAGLAMLAGVSLVYGGDALSISPDGKIGIGTATPAAKLDVAGDARITGGIAGPIGIGTATPAATLDVVGGFLHVAGAAPTVTSQGAYLGWNASNGVGETDFINNQGLGSGGFEFVNTPLSGDTRDRKSLMFISGAGNVNVTGTLTAGDKFTGKGDASLEKGLTVTGDTTLQKSLTLAGPIKFNNKNALEFTADGGTTLNGNLNVAQDITASGAVDGNMKVVYQRDDETQTTYQKPLWRYHMSLTAAKYGGRTKTIPSAILTALCGKPDGCEVRLGMTRWDNAILTESASISGKLYIGQNGRWRVSEPPYREGVGEGVVGNGRTEHAMDAWKTCYLTDGTYDNYQDKGDKQTGLQLLVWNNEGKYNNPARTCELTIIP
jgi:hypothetical protein